MIKEEGYSLDYEEYWKEMSVLSASSDPEGKEADNMRGKEGRIVIK